MPAPTGSDPDLDRSDGRATASNGVTATTEPVAGGYYLVYAPADLSTGSLVFYDARGQVVDELALHPHP